MKGVLEIWDRDARGSLAPELTHVLAVIGAELERFGWALTCLDGAAGDITDWWPDGMAHLEEQVRADGRVPLTRGALGSLAPLTLPAAWVRLEGTSSLGQLHILLFDSTYWRIETDVPGLADRFRATFSDVRG